MALWDDVKKAAKDATQNSQDLPRLVDELLAMVRTRATPQGPPTIILDASGNTALETQPGSLAILGKSLLLLAVSLATLGLTWLTTALLALYVLIQRIFGLRIRVEQPAR